MNKLNEPPPMPNSFLNFFALTILFVSSTHQVLSEPILSSWYLERAGNYARIWKSIEDETTEKTTGVVTSVTTWDADTVDGRPFIGTQDSPIYAGIQGVSYSEDYVYIKATGLAVHTMGPWYDDSDKTVAFPSWPANAAILFRFPRETNYPQDYTNPNNLSGLGTNGLMVDSVPIFNSSDGSSYDDAGVWNQDAFYNEGGTFDAANAHQAAEAHHYHANPPALRHLLGDSVEYDPETVYTGLASNGGVSPYTEVPNGQHSPIIGWVVDGLPLYGPYGYSDPNDPTSEVRRMVSGYQVRDGSNGSYDLSSNGRNLLPEWSITLGNTNSTTPSSDGPSVDETGRYRLGSYIEDYAYKDDLDGFKLYEGLATDGAFDESVHFDLNIYNVRYCVTPEFPEGTWAYFTCIESDGVPIYPYNIGNRYFGDSSSATAVTEIDEPVTEVFAGAESIVDSLTGNPEISDDGTITIIWEGVEGGNYKVQTSNNLSDWDTSSNEFTATSTQFETVSELSDDASAPNFYQLYRSGLADYDDTEFGSSGGGGGPGGGGPP
ncbi:YHYH protein [Puniceicoccaceae bacterium K14]|nr:YHYH protein [Puniceicoccaceae bacterium K14]